MKKIVTAVICGFALLAAAAAAAGPPIELPVLTRAASRLSGIAAHHRVRTVRESAAGMRTQATRLLDRDYPPDQQAYDESMYRALGLLPAGGSLRSVLLDAATRNVLGLYDPVARVLYVRRGRTLKRALVHELVHALQDQVFNLRRLSGLRRGSRDAAAAASAAVEGDATFAAGIGGGIVPVDGSGADEVPQSPLGAFLELEHEFPYTTGVRFVATLHNLGGNRAVFSALRTFPLTTEQVFHIDAFLTQEPAAAIDLPASVGGWSLARTDTFGELDVRALLATFRVSGLDRAAGGWGGGRTGVYRDAAGGQGTVVALDWDTEADAAQWAEAVGVYVNEAFDAAAPGFPAATPCPSTTCWAVGGRSIAFARYGGRTALAFAPTIAAAADLARTTAAS